MEYEKAFNNDPGLKTNIETDVEQIVSSKIDVNSQEFLDKMFQSIDEKIRKREEVNNAAYQFFTYAEFFTLTNEEDLPDEIKKDYDNSPLKELLKSKYSVENGVFVNNEKIEISPEREKYFKEVYNQLRTQLNNK